MTDDMKAEAAKFVASAKSLTARATQISSFGDFVAFIFAAKHELIAQVEGLPPLDPRHDHDLKVFSIFDNAASEVLDALAVSTPWQVAGFSDRSILTESPRNAKPALAAVVELARDLDTAAQIVLAARLYRYFDTLLGLRVVALTRLFPSYYAHFLANIVEVAAFQEPSCLSLLSPDEIETLACAGEMKFTPPVYPPFSPAAGSQLFHIDLFAAVRNAQFQAVTGLIRSLKNKDSEIARGADAALERAEQFFIGRDLLPLPSSMFDFNVPFNLYSLISHIERLQPPSANRAGHAYLMEIAESNVSIFVGFPSVCDYMAEPNPENRRRYEANPLRFAFDHVKSGEVFRPRRIAEARWVLQTVKTDAAVAAELRSFLRITADAAKVVADVAIDSVVIGAATYAVSKMWDSHDPVRDAAVATAVSEFLKEISRRARHRDHA